MAEYELAAPEGLQDFEIDGNGWFWFEADEADSDDEDGDDDSDEEPTDEEDSDEETSDDDGEWAVEEDEEDETFHAWANGQPFYFEDYEEEDEGTSNSDSDSDSDSDDDEEGEEGSEGHVIVNGAGNVFLVFFPVGA